MGNPLTSCPAAQAESGTVYPEMRYSHLGRIWVFLHVLEPDVTLSTQTL